jgi:hypothetical protein
MNSRARNRIPVNEWLEIYENRPNGGNDALGASMNAMLELVSSACVRIACVAKQ